MTAAEVILWGTKIGTVVYEPETSLASFEYDGGFLRSGIELSPIAMPLAGRIYTFPELSYRSFHGLPGMLADSLPDKFGNAVIDAWLETQGRSPGSLDPVERLCYTGSRGMGALEYRPARDFSAGEAQGLKIDRLVQLAADILHNRKTMHIPVDEHAMSEIIKVGTSAGGARAKAVIAWNEHTGDIRSGQIDAGTGYRYWLIKFDGVSGNGDKEGEDDPGYTKIEYAYYLMAQKAGITMNECRLYEESGRSHFMTLRFDRDQETGAKRHMQSLGGIAHFDYNLPGAYSYEQAAEVMRRLRISKPEILQLYRRMIFNVMARNQDDHVKNISFLMDRKGQWSLAPAYDVTYAYNPGGIWTGSHQMRIHGKRAGIQQEDLILAGKSMDIGKHDAEQMIEEVRAALNQWPDYAAQAKLSEDKALRISKQFLML